MPALSRSLPQNEQRQLDEVSGRCSRRRQYTLRWPVTDVVVAFVHGDDAVGHLPPIEAFFKCAQNVLARDSDSAGPAEHPYRTTLTAANRNLCMVGRNTHSFTLPSEALDEML